MSEGFAFLRGINVGGKNMLPMRELAAIFEGAGCRAVRTYIQSGNVLFDAPQTVMAKVATSVAAEIARAKKIVVPVVVRTRAELEKAIAANPYLAAGDVAKILHMALLADAPTKKAVATLDPQRSPPDTFIVHGREIYLRMPGGLGHSKLTNAYFDSRLETVSTIRNWRTLTTLVTL